MQVLLTEDNEINMEIAAEILEACGLKITKAWNGKEALDIYLEHAPYYFDFILMDMQMPGIFSWSGTVYCTGNLLCIFLYFHYVQSYGSSG